jgi:hypothetical protein
MRIPVIRGTAGPGRQFSGVIFIDTGPGSIPQNGASRRVRELRRTSPRSEAPRIRSRPSEAFTSRDAKGLIRWLSSSFSLGWVHLLLR